MSGIPGQNAVNFPTVDDVDRGFGQASRRTDFFCLGRVLGCAEKFGNFAFGIGEGCGYGMAPVKNERRFAAAGTENFLDIFFSLLNDFAQRTDRFVSKPFGFGGRQFIAP